MTDTRSDRTMLFVSPPGAITDGAITDGAVTDGADVGGAADADGSVQRPFPAIDGALEETSRRIAGSESIAEDIDIVCLERPGAKYPPRSEPRYQFYLDPYDTSARPDGSETSPWRSLKQAIRGLVELNQAGKLPLVPGEHLALRRHRVFTATRMDRRKARSELIAKFVFLTMSLLLVAPVLAVLTYLVVQAWPSLTSEFLLRNPVDMGRAGGVWAPLIGTFMLVLVSLLFAAPVGVLAGVYLNEYAPDNWLTRMVNLAVVNLAGVPSIVHGLFGFGAFVMFAGMGKSVLAASCTLAVMTMPVVITSTREALAAVPMPFREACWNMGATRWQTIRTIVLPNSLRGMLTGIILEVSRAAGETAPILFTGAAIYLKVADSGWESLTPFSLDQPFMALSMHLFTVRTQVAGVPESMQFATAVVLIGLVLVVNSFAIALRVYLRTQKKW